MLTLYSNNTLDIDLIECVEKENFAFDKVETSPPNSEHKVDNDASVYAVRRVLRKR